MNKVRIKATLWTISCLGFWIYCVWDLFPDAIEMLKEFEPHWWAQLSFVEFVIMSIGVPIAVIYFLIKGWLDFLFDESFSDEEEGIENEEEMKE
jgi:uncharacterized protein involved in cysteine biosynthesis